MFANASVGLEKGIGAAWDYHPQGVAGWNLYKKGAGKDIPEAAWHRIEAAQKKNNTVDKSYLYTAQMEGRKAMPMVFRKNGGGKGMKKVFRVFRTKAAKGEMGFVDMDAAAQSASWGNPKELPDDPNNSTQDVSAFGSMFGDMSTFMKAPDSYHGRPKTHLDLDRDMEARSEYRSVVVLNMVSAIRTWQVGDFAPYEYFPGSVKVLHTFVFDQTLGHRTTYEVPPHLVSFTEKIKKAGVAYFNLGKEMEATFFRRAMGRFIWDCHDDQLISGMALTTALGAEMEFIFSQAGARTRPEMEGDGYSAAAFEAVLDREKRTWDGFKKKDGAHEIIAEVMDILQLRGQSADGLRMVISVKAARQYFLQPYQRDFRETGIPRDHPDSYQSMHFPGIAKIFFRRPLPSVALGVADAWAKMATIGVYSWVDPLNCESVTRADEGFNSMDTAMQRYFDSDDDFCTTSQRTLFVNSILYQDELTYQGLDGQIGQVIPAGGSREKWLTKEGASILGVKIEKADAGKDDGDVQPDEDVGAPMADKFKDRSIWDVYTECDPPVPEFVITFIDKRIELANAKLSASSKMPTLKETSVLSDKHWLQHFDNHVPVILPAYDVAPACTYFAQIVGFYKPGCAKTLVNLPDYMVGVDAKSKVMFGHLSWHARTMIEDEDGIVIVDNVFVDRYVCGNDQSFWTLADRDEWRRLGEGEYKVTKSRFSLILRPTEPIQRMRFDISGAFAAFYREQDIAQSATGEDVIKWHYSTAPEHVAVWGFEATPDEKDRAYQAMNGPRGRTNTIVRAAKTLFKCLTSSGKTLDFRSATTDQTHWEEGNVYPGCGAVRNGNAVYRPESNPYSNSAAFAKYGFRTV